MAFVDITYCTTTTSDLAYIISSLNSSRPIKFLTQLSPFVKYNFKGRLAGLLDDFVANGKLQTNIGEMYMDVLLRENTQKGGLHLEGNLTADKFNVGTLINNKTLGEVSFNSNMTALLRDTKRGRQRVLHRQYNRKAAGVSGLLLQQYTGYRELCRREV